MRKIIIIIFALTFPVSAFSEINCTPNLINVDMCEKAREFVDNMAPTLPMQVNANMTWYSVAAIGPAIVGTYRFTYDRVYLEQIFAGNDASIDDAKQGMRNMADNFCRQKVPNAFISLGGKWVVNYIFSDGELFLRHIIEECD